MDIQINITSASPGARTLFAASLRRFIASYRFPEPTSASCYTYDNFDQPESTAIVEFDIRTNNANS